MGSGGLVGYIRFVWSGLLLIASFSAHANRFGIGEEDGYSGAPSGLVAYVAVLFALLIHEKSPLHEWGKDHPWLAYGGGLAVTPLLYSFNLLWLSAIGIAVLLAVTAAFVRGGRANPVNPVCNAAVETAVKQEAQSENDSSLKPSSAGARSLDRMFEQPFVDLAIDYALACQFEQLRAAVTATARKIGSDYPGTYPPPDWMSFAGLPDDYPRGQSIYDMVVDYIMDKRAPMIRFGSDERKSVHAHLPEMKRSLVQYFSSFELLSDESVMEVAFAVLLYEAGNIVSRKLPVVGVNKKFSGSRRFIAPSLPDYCIGIDAFC